MGVRMPALSLTCLALMAGVANSAVESDAIAASERALYAGQLDRADSLLAHALAQHPQSRRASELLLQRLRVQAAARLSGKPDAREADTLEQTRRAVGATSDSQLEARLEFSAALSDYFRRITGPAPGKLDDLAARFAQAAAALHEPCRQADALFFAALMPQMSGQVAASAAGLDRALQRAQSSGCRLEASYDLRHLAVVAEDAGDLALARKLAAESLAIRRSIGFRIYLPYSLTASAELDAEAGDKVMARRHADEALRVAQQMNLPAQISAATETLTGLGIK